MLGDVVSVYLSARVNVSAPISKDGGIDILVGGILAVTVYFEIILFLATWYPVI